MVACVFSGNSLKYDDSFQGVVGTALVIDSITNIIFENCLFSVFLFVLTKELNIFQGKYY